MQFKPFFLGGAAILIVFVGGSSVTLAENDTVGSCTYQQENSFMGPFNVCQQPVSADRCIEIGETDDNKGAIHAATSCVKKDLVGICEIDESKKYYFSGVPNGLEIACGFQGGTWRTHE